MSRAARSKVETPVACECVGITELVKDIKKKLEACYEIIFEQNSKINELQKEIKELKDNSTKPTEPETTPAQVTYAEIVGKQDHVLVVRPKNEKKESNEVKEDLKSNINPAELQVGLLMDRNTRNGGVILKCTNKEALNTVKNNIRTKMGDEYEIQVPKKLNPRFLITGIDEEELKNGSEVKELTHKIIKQNRIPQGDNFRFEGIRKTRTRRGRFNLIVEVDSETFKYIISKEDQALNIGWNNCNIYEHFSVRRCFKCGGYNHEAKDCKEKVTCVMCAEEHKSEVCRSESKKCINCVRANQKLNLNLDIQHAAIDRKCECYLRIVESIKKKTAYEE